MRLLSLAPVRSRGQDGESCASYPDTGVREVGVKSWGTLAFPEPREESGRVGA